MKSKCVPSSSFKAGEVKNLMFWIAEACNNWLLLGIGRFDVNVATAMSAATFELASFYKVICDAGIVLNAHEVESATDHANRFFGFYSFLASWSFTTGRSFFRPRPKLHQFQCRLIERLLACPINPNFFSCWHDEGAVGFFCRMATKCHSSLVARGTILRWMLLLATSFVDQSVKY